jgi:hypothetical protein
VNEKQREVTQRSQARQALKCRRSGWCVSGRRSTAAETDENKAAIPFNAPFNLLLVASSRLRLRRHCAAEVLTAFPASPRESVRGGPAKKRRGNKQSQHAILIRHVDVVCKWRFSTFCAVVPTQNGSVTRNGSHCAHCEGHCSALRCIAKLRNIRPKRRPHRYDTSSMTQKIPNVRQS